MKTKILKAHELDIAVDLLKNGEVVALPTETVYGLAADAKNNHAIKKIFEAKDRPKDHPLILHIDSSKKLDEWAEDISLEAQKLAEYFWPGPLTMILNKKKHVDDAITGGLNTIGIRIPNHPIILEIMNKLGRGIVAPSANAHKKISPTQAMHVLKTLDGKISAIVDGGTSCIGIESTIIDMTQTIPTILRYGCITQEMIEQVLGRSIKSAVHHDVKVSGNMKNHYQPEKPLILISKNELEALLPEESPSAIMHYSDILKKDGFIYYRMPDNKQAYAQRLYSALHDIDSMAIKKIFVEKPPLSDIWNDVLDRLIKASKK